MPNQETLRRAQNSFSGGEIGSKVLGRVDIAKFNSGLRLAKNVFVEIEGAISNRSGTIYGGVAATSSGKIRFFRFEAPEDVSYVIEITPLKFRFIFDNALVLTGGGVPVEVVTPYLEDQLYDLVFAQTNDIMTITHIAHAPVELRRTAFNAFSLVSIVSNPVITVPGTPTIAASAGAGAGEAEQAYVVSTINADGVEGLPSAKIVQENALTVAGDHITIGWNEVAGASAYIVYKRRAGMFGFMAYVRAEDNFGGVAPTRTYRSVDNNLNPNVSQTPKRAENPFPTSNDNPAICFFFQQRRCFAASYNRPNGFTISQIGVFDGFRSSIPGLPDDAFEFALGAARTQRIKHVISLDDLLIFTSSQEWRLSTNSVGFSASQPPDLRPQSSIGVSEIPPLVVGTDVMYIPASKRGMYRMNYSFDFNKFMSDDISVLSKHLFRNRRLVGWCYAQEPNFLVYGFFDDGQGIIFAYNREQQVYAFTRFETDGFIDAMCTIREDGIDRVYVAVRRVVNGNTVRYFERLANRDFMDITTAFFVDCGAFAQTNITIANVAGGVVYTASPHGFSNGQSVRLYEIVGFNPVDASFQINTRYKVSVVNATQFTLNSYDTGLPVNIDNFVYAGKGVARPMISSMSGLGHLEGRAVSVLADGFVVEGLVVASGNITLPFEAGRITAGLPYESEIHTLELEREDAPTRGRKKTVSHLVARVQETRGIKVGTRDNKVYELKERDYEALPDPVNPGSEVFRQNIGTGWSDEVKLIIIQDKPLPMTVLSVIPEYTFGE